MCPCVPIPFLIYLSCFGDPGRVLGTAYSATATHFSGIMHYTTNEDICYLPSSASNVGHNIRQYLLTL